MRKYTILMTLLLLVLLAIPVFAAPAGTLTVGQTVTVNAIPNGQVDYTFTPTESGDYAVCMEETGANFEGWVCLDGGVAVPERYYWVAGWERKVFSLTAGKTYTIRITHDTGFGGTLSRKLRLEKVTSTTSLSQATVLLDPAALASIASQSRDQMIELHLRQVQQDALTARQQQVLQRHNVACIVSASVLCGENSIHDFGGGTVTVQIPFEGEPGRTYRVIYIADNGEVEQIPAQYEDGRMEFTTGHFSEYAVVREDAAQMGDVQIKDAGFLWAVVALGTGILAAGAAFWIKKKRSAKRDN